jgi:excinuclease ABC subunit C
MAISDLKGQIARLPEQPGVYLFANAAGETLYVGKARVLRDRVRSYLGAQGVSPRIDALLRDAASLDVIVTDSVVEALALENRLIKQRSPRYNILLRDDKTYPYLQLTLPERAPRVLVARQVERDGSVYAGPFMPAALARRTIELTHRLFGIRSCNEIIDGRRPRPCLEYDIKRCIAPCVESICTIERYGQAVEQAKLLLEGKQEELLENLRREMEQAAADERFERAAHVRDAIRTISTLRDRQQKMESPSFGDRDAVGLKAGPAGAVVQVFQMRHGRVVDRTELASDMTGASEADGTRFSEAEIVTAALQDFYAQHEPPPEVHVPVDLPAEDRDALEGWLSERVGRRVRLAVPQRGEKRALLELASRNAAMAYQSRFNPATMASFEALDTLRGVLNLPALPRRIECFDISTLQGRETVASMVVCVDGRMRRAEYRKFRIKGDGGLRPQGDLDGTEREGAFASEPRERSGASGVPASERVGGFAAAKPPEQKNDDFAAMHEVVLRRYRRLLEHGDPFPDLILIDGGKGQLTAAYEALREVGLDRLVATGIAKQEELLFTRDRADGIALPRDHPALLLIQRIRDEAHRFALTFHRRARTMRDLRSALDEIPGIGPRRRKQLLTTFGSLAGVRRASREELTAAVGGKTAEAVLKHFAGGQ